MTSVPVHTELCPRRGAIGAAGSSRHRSSAKRYAAPAATGSRSPPSLQTTRSTPVHTGAPVAFPGSAANVRHDPARTGADDVVGVEARWTVVATLADPTAGCLGDVEVTEGGLTVESGTGATVDVVTEGAEVRDVANDTDGGGVAFVRVVPHPAATPASTTATMLHP